MENQLSTAPRLKARRKLYISICIDSLDACQATNRTHHGSRSFHVVKNTAIIRSRATHCLGIRKLKRAVAMMPAGQGGDPRKAFTSERPNLPERSPVR
jgi:hypothetical protein